MTHVGQFCLYGCSMNVYNGKVWRPNDGESAFVNGLLPRAGGAWCWNDFNQDTINWVYEGTDWQDYFWEFEYGTFTGNSKNNKSVEKLLQTLRDDYSQYVEVTDSTIKVKNNHIIRFEKLPHGCGTIIDILDDYTINKKNKK